MITITYHLDFFLNALYFYFIYFNTCFIFYDLYLIFHKFINLIKNISYIFVYVSLLYFNFIFNLNLL